VFREDLNLSRNRGVRAARRNPERKRRITIRVFREDLSLSRNRGVRAARRNPERKRRITIRVFREDRNLSRNRGVRAARRNPERKRRITIRVFREDLNSRGLFPRLAEPRPKKSSNRPGRAATLFSSKKSWKKTAVIPR